MALLRFAALSTAVLASTAAFAGKPAIPRYTVIEAAAPSPGDAGCLPGYSTRNTVTGLNAAGVASANFRCYREVVTEPNPFVNFTYRPYATAAHLGAVPLTLPAGSENAGFTISLDSQRAYGEAFGNSTRAAAWTLAGGYEDAFQPFDCGGDFRLDIANNGNENGYVVGLALRTDPSLLPPLDTFCLAIGWVVRTPTGQFYGPVNGAAIDVNNANVAVGNAGHAAIMMHLPSRREFVLNAGDETHSYTPSDINDRGEVLGYLEDVPAIDNGSRCGPSTPIFWQRSGAQLTLPKLPGAASARPWSTYANGVVVGESGAGGYCLGNSLFDNRAVIWHGSSVFDLNSLIPADENITLAYAAEINASGVIVASGYRNDDPLRPCPDYATNPDTGLLEMDMTLTCRDVRVYLLTPVATSP